MSGEAWLAQALALFFALTAIGAAWLALSVRSLFAMCMALAGLAACAAAALLAMGAGEAGAAIALFGAGLAPVFLLAAMLLSARAAKAMKHGPIWFSAIGAAALAGVVAWVAPELASAPPARALEGAAAPWLAALVFVAALGLVGLLGYGERGPFGGPKP